jgi:hypothetical protein
MRSCALDRITRLVDPAPVIRLSSMPMKAPGESKAITVEDLFPGLPENELKEVQEALDAYCGLALQIFTRLEQEHREPFDGRSTDS